ncbi:ImmA/IrrE family metallo-endopeptidase [Mycetocola reblochoni]|uniref:ImmA/IrrE family metallo-endopeptidase n=1 Tax=Mycetocola reblochoni TaxID=331618 RepID=UPI000B358B7B
MHGAHLPDPYLGYYEHAQARIWYSLDLTRAERRVVVAHELGHARYGHTCDSPREERQADRFAAQLLIRPRDYEQAERVSADAHAIAEELNVTPRLVEVYRVHCLHQIKPLLSHA